MHVEAHDVMHQQVVTAASVVQGLVSGTAPYVLWFFFTNDANLICNNCVIEHDCAGGNADYFMQKVSLVRPPPRSPCHCCTAHSSWADAPVRPPKHSSSESEVCS